MRITSASRSGKHSLTFKRSRRTATAAVILFASISAMLSFHLDFDSWTDGGPDDDGANKKNDKGDGSDVGRKMGLVHGENAKFSADTSTPDARLLAEIGSALLDAMGLSGADTARDTQQLHAIRDALRGSARNFRHPPALTTALSKEGAGKANAYVSCTTTRECATQMLYHLTNGLRGQLIPRHAWNGARGRIFDRMFMTSLIQKYGDRVAPGARCLEWSPIFYTQPGGEFGDACASRWKFEFTSRGDPLRAEAFKGGGSLKGDICAAPVVVPTELENTFDFVLMTDVLEHVPDPFVTMEVIHRLLKPGGLLLKTAPWFTMTHSKVHYWGVNAKGLLEVLERAQFHVEKVRTCGKPHSVIQWLYGMNADFFEEGSDLFDCAEETPEQVRGRGYKPNYLQTQAVATKPLA